MVMPGGGGREPISCSCQINFLSIITSSPSPLHLSILFSCPPPPSSVYSHPPIPILPVLHFPLHVLADFAVARAPAPPPSALPVSPAVISDPRKKATGTSGNSLLPWQDAQSSFWPNSPSTHTDNHPPACTRTHALTHPWVQEGKWGLCY